MSKSYFAARLARESQYNEKARQLKEKVDNGNIKIHNAAIQMGWLKNSTDYVLEKIISRAKNNATIADYLIQYDNGDISLTRLKYLERLERESKVNKRISEVKREYENGEITLGHALVILGWKKKENQYILERLNREAQESLEVERVRKRYINGDLSLHSAAIKLGWRKPPQ